MPTALCYSRAHNNDVSQDSLVQPMDRTKSFLHIMNSFTILNVVLQLVFYDVIVNLLTLKLSYQGIVNLIGHILQNSQSNSFK